MKLIFRLFTVAFAIGAVGPASSAMEMPENISTYFQTRALTSDELLPALASDGKMFAEYVVTNRVHILNNFEKLAPTPTKQKLLFAAMEFTSGSDYLATLQRVCDLKEANSITLEVFKFAIRGTRIKNGFLSYNYQNTAVRALLHRAQTLVPDDASFQKQLASLLDGSQKKTHKRYFLDEGLTEPEMLPQ